MVRIIDRKALKAKIDRGEPFRLVMAMDQWHFDACRIPGSILAATKKDALARLRKEEEIVVYCSEDTCYTSRAVADFLERSGYTNIWHYPGGLADWETAGYPLEGDMIPDRGSRPAAAD